MKLIARQDFVNAIEAGIERAGWNDTWKGTRLRELGKNAEHTLVYSFQNRARTVRCPIIEAIGPCIGEDGWAFVWTFDREASAHVHVVGDDDFDAIKVVDQLV